MNILLTGGAGFIGRWVAQRLLSDGHDLWILDDLSNGRKENIEEFLGHNGLREFIQGDIKNEALLEKLFSSVKFDICYHLGASINVQDSIDDPRTTFYNDTVGTFNVMEQCRKHRVKVVFMSTCMVYDRCTDPTGITEQHPIKPASPYAGAKIAAENMVLSYYYAYGLPVVVIRPFNTYGPFQKTGGEGGVAITIDCIYLDRLSLSIKCTSAGFPQRFINTFPGKREEVIRVATTALILTLFHRLSQEMQQYVPSTFHPSKYVNCCLIRTGRLDTQKALFDEHQ